MLQKMIKLRTSNGCIFSLAVVALFLATSSIGMVGVGGQGVPELYEHSHTMDVAFGYWCSEAEFGCKFRLFGNLGGELLMIDSGSSTLAFCDIPNPNRVYGVKRLVSDASITSPSKYLSQCLRYGGGTHGWFGPSYVGNLVELDDDDESTPAANSVFSVMDKVVGLTGNSCGGIDEGSKGLELSTVRGTWGLGGIPGIGSNTFVLEQDINWDTWPKLDDREDKSGGRSYCPATDTRGCKCPKHVVELPSNFNSAMARRKADQWSLSWDGTLGKASGKLTYGKAGQVIDTSGTGNTEADSSQGIRSDAVPKIEIVRNEILTYETTVSQIDVDGSAPLMEPTPYHVDTGSDKIYLPPNVYTAVTQTLAANPDAVSVLTIYFPRLSGFGNTTIDISITTNLIEDDVFKMGKEGDRYVFGLHFWRYVTTASFSFAGDSPYLQLLPREKHILYSTVDLPLSRNGLAGSLTNVTMDLTAYMSGSSSKFETVSTKVGAAMALGFATQAFIGWVAFSMM